MVTKKAAKPAKSVEPAEETKPMELTEEQWHELSSEAVAWYYIIKTKVTELVESVGRTLRAVEVPFSPLRELFDEKELARVCSHLEQAEMLLANTSGKPLPPDIPDPAGVLKSFE